MNRKILSVLSLVVVLVVSTFGIASAQNDGPIEPLDPAPSPESGVTDETPRFWFVEMPSGPTADGTPSVTVKKEKDNFRAEARRVGLQYQERYAFDTLWNGLSIDASAAELGKLSRMTSVKAVYPVGIVPLPATSPFSDPELATALAMTGADIAQNELGYSGAGVRVAIMDTGVDYDHPDLGGCFGPGCRVVTGYDLVGDAYNADTASTAYNPVPAPDNLPDDCNGHGTHVAGIVGANGGARGVAPDVTFGAYRVFGCAGSTTDDVMIAAMERALADNMDVLNMSIGDAFNNWPQSPTAQASDRLVNKGVVVVASIGNSGANGLYSGGVPGMGNKVIGVASYDNSHVRLATFTVTPANITAGYGNAAAAPPAPTSGSLPMAKTGTPTTTNDACGPTPLPDLTGKAVLIRRGTCTFYEKARRAQLAGASAVVLYNNVAGRISPTVAVSPGVADGQPVTIPVVAISDTEGVAINNAIDSAPQTLNWTDQTGTFPNPTGGLISSFSSYGLGAELALKPDIGAPGGLIRSTYPLEAGGYATISGTSMASPHVAGGVALYLEAHPNTSPQLIRDILQNSADPKNWWGNPALGFLDNVHRQGAGMVDIDDAILATTQVTPGKLSLGESQTGPTTRTLTIRNGGTTDVTYNLSHTPALSTGPNTFTPAFFTGFASVAFSTASVSVPAGGSATVDVTITANATLADKSQYGGYIVFTPQGGGQIYQVPYAGFKGDYQSIQVLVPTVSGYPWLAKLTGCTQFVGNACTIGATYAKQPGSATYTMVASGQLPSHDIPYFLVHFDHQARLIRFEVYDTAGRAWHRAIQAQYWPRNSTNTNASTSYSAFAWDGTTSAGNRTYTVPDGQYVVKLSVLKALGDSANPAHWETWTSPVITVDRP